MLPQFGLSEFLMIAIVALIVVGPKDLPLMMRKLGKWVGQAKRMANEFRGAFDDIARQAELDELRKEIEDLKRHNELEQAVRELKETEDAINSTVMKTEAELKESKLSEVKSADAEAEAPPEPPEPPPEPQTDSEMLEAKPTQKPVVKSETTGER